MKEDRDYTQDLADIRSMMERSSKFLSLSGLAGVMAGIYALIGAWVAYSVYNITPDRLTSGAAASQITELTFIGAIVLVLAVGTAVLLSVQKARKRGESVWNGSSKRMLANMFMPLATGGVLILVALTKGAIVLILPVSLIFYGMAIYNASNFSYADVKYLGMIQVALGLLAAIYPVYSLYFWATGFGVIHIIYGIYMHIRYER